jgi:transposase
MTARSAAALCEAVSRPQLRFVPSQTGEQPAVLTVPRARELLVSERTAVANQLRGLLWEYGVASAPGLQRLRRELPAVLRAADAGVPPWARTGVTELPARVRELAERLVGHDRQSAQVARQHEAAKRLLRVEGVGPSTAPARVATGGAAKAFHHGRQFAAGLGRVPKQFRTGGKPVLRRSTKRGKVSLRPLLLHGARAVLQCTAKRTEAKSQWGEELRPRRGDTSAAVALAAQHARSLGALLAGG